MNSAAILPGSHKALSFKEPRRAGVKRLDLNNENASAEALGIVQQQFGGARPARARRHDDLMQAMGRRLKRHKPGDPAGAGVHRAHCAGASIM
jgi:hypothetical protein